MLPLSRAQLRPRDRMGCDWQQTLMMVESCLSVVHLGKTSEMVVNERSIRELLGDGEMEGFWF